MDAASPAAALHLSSSVIIYKQMQIVFTSNRRENLGTQCEGKVEQIHCDVLQQILLKSIRYGGTLDTENKVFQFASLLEPYSFGWNFSQMSVIVCSLCLD